MNYTLDNKIPKEYVELNHSKMSGVDNHMRIRKTM